ncbi:two-partner secretion domain-containing protein [Pasteurella multocida]|uniref:two-partner secretion domain-containing protein n=1 Tax=Pasteurella multocida TaxID=747 RepID=UPI00397A0FD1
MNKNCFRVIFSKTLQCLVVTSEIAKTEGKSTERASSPFPQLFAKIQSLTFSLFCALGFVSFSSTVSAELIIQADKSAPKTQQPIVLQTANGLPQVNIQTPNEQGLSHNKYSKFDVDTKGAILNNSRTNVQTQQGDWVQGNPYLARGEAKVILNEVNSSDPSVLKGYVEVAGKKADVIIANPSGIHCKGCGVINSDRTTLTTGKPQIQNGNLESFVVEKGKVSVSGKGLDNSRVDYTEIIAREAQINAGVWSKKEMKVVTGKNTVKRTDKPEDLQIIHTNQATAQESQPQVAIDVGQLGGMYAGKIHLIGTEQGVGVHNAGHIGASAETLKIDSQGRIVNSGTLNANNAIQLTGTKGIENRGKIENRQGDIALNTPSDIKQDGSLVARSGNIHKTANRGITQQGESIAKGNINYNAPSVTASTRSLIAAGVEVKDTSEGEIRSLENRSAQGKTIAIKSSANATLQGRNLASGKINVEGANINLDHSQNSAYDIDVRAKQGDVQADSSTLTAQNHLLLTTVKTLSTQSSHLTADSIETVQESLNAANAVWKQTGNSDFHLKGKIVNTKGGSFTSQGNLLVEGTRLENTQGILRSGKSLVVNVVENINSTEGQLLATENINLTTTHLHNDRGFIYGKQHINLDSESLSNKDTNRENKGIVAGQNLSFNSKTINNQQGYIAAQTTLLNSDNVINDEGTIYARDELNLNMQKATNHQGTISAEKQATLSLFQLEQKNGLIDAKTLHLNANTVNSTNNSLILAENLNIQVAEKLNNHNSRIVAKSGGKVMTHGELSNQNGTIGSQTGSLTVNTHQNFVDNQQGKIVAANLLELQTGSINNEQGLISAKNIVINTHRQSLNNQNTVSKFSDKGIIAQESLSIETQAFDNNKGYLMSLRQLGINADELSNRNGYIEVGNNGTLNTAKLYNDSGKIRGGNQLALNTNALLQTDGLIYAQGLNITASILNSTQNSEISGNQVSVNTDELNNHNSTLVAKQNITVDSKNGIQNQRGTIASLQGHLAINTDQAELNNAVGTIVAQNATLNLQTGHIDNRQGKIRAKQATINARQHSLDNRNTLADQTQGIIVDDLALNVSVVNNQQGRIIARNDSIINGQRIDNQSGQIAIKNTGQLKAAQIDNSKGTIVSTDDKLALTTESELNNQQGNIGALKEVTLSSQGLANQGGNITSSGELILDTHQQAIDNQNGRIFAEQNAEIRSGAIDNRKGLLRADNSLNINTHQQTLDNRQTQQQNQGIVGIGNIVLDAVSDLLNQQGSIYAQKSLSAKIQDNVDNGAGIISAKQFLKLSTTELDNQGGTISAKVGSIAANHINNRAVSETGSLILGNASLNLNATKIDNQGTKAKTNLPLQGIQAHQLAINSDTLLNQQGGIYSSDNANIIANLRFDNQHGELLSANSIAIRHQGSLLLNNQGGLIQGKNHIDLTAKGLENEGHIKTEGDLTVDLKDSFTLNQAFDVGNNLAFNTEGNFENNTILRVKNKASFSANQIINNADSEISATEAHLQSNSLTNRGLIDSEKTVIQSNHITNIGTGRIYGDHLAFKAQSINNLAETVNGETKAGTIAARERLDFGVNTLINQDGALILSLGTTEIGNTLDKNDNAVGKANLIQNDSATIELLGNTVVNAKNVINRDTKIKTRIREEREEFDLYGKENSTTKKISEWYRIGVDGEMDHANGQRRKNATFTFYDRTKGQISSQKGDYWHRRVFTQTRYIPEIYDESPAKFLVGGNLHLNSENTLNQYSRLLIGGKLYFNEQNILQPDENIDLNNGKLVNEDFTATQLIHDQGYFYYYQQDRRRSGKRKRHKNFLDEKVKDVIDEQSLKQLHFDLALNTIGNPLAKSDSKIENQVTASNIALDSVSLTQSNQTALDPVSTVVVDKTDDKAIDISLAPRVEDHNQIITSGQVIGKIKPAEGGAKISGEMALPTIKTHLTDVRLPTASLYKINPDSPKGYLVETDPAFTQHKKWLSSDYMFNALRYDHENVHKRLGDGYYEQRLINEQINQLTGRRYIEGYFNDLEQYQALMNNGVKYAKQFNLTIGVGLSAKQMAELTTDMVWLVNKEVTLKNGKKVTALVPQVYLIARHTDVTASSGVISANQIVGKMNKLENSGVIAGKDLSRIHSNELENQGAILGDSVDLSAKQTLINLGGRIEAVEALSLFAGNRLEIGSTLSESESRNGNFARTQVDQVGSVSVSGKNGQLNLLSEGNLTIKAAKVSSQGALNLGADNLEISSLEVKNREHYNGDADNYYRLEQHLEVGSSLKGKDGVNLVAKNDVQIRQSDINSENGTVLIGAQQGNIKIEEGREEEQLASASKSVRKGRFGLSKTTEIRRHEHHINQAVGSNIDGKAVNLIANQGIVDVQGSNVVAENDLRVQAKNIDIKEAENRVYSEDFYSKKKSGLLGSGGIGITFGSKKQTTEADQTKHYAVGSQVGSLNGNATFIAENHYTQTASAVSSVKGDVAILAEQVNIQAADDKYESNYKQTFEQKGLTLAITSPILSALQAVQSAVKSGEKVGNSKNDRVNAMAAANAGMDVYRAGQAVGQAGKALQDAMGEGGVDSVVGVQITYGQQKSVNQTHTAGKTVATSQVNAGGKVNIIATGAGKDSTIHIKGSDVSGKGGTTLIADNAINITAAEQSHKERSTNKSSGFNAGVAIKVSNGVAAGVTVGGNYGKGYGNGDETSYVASHVGDIHSQTTINAGGDANLIGSQLKGKGINLNAENLNIESLQDTATYKGKQINVAGSVTVGYGVAVGGSYSQSRINADHASVNEQAGIYTGDNGYNINVNKHTDLKGAIITSTQQAEEEGKNSFSTGSLSHSDIENHSNYSGSSFGVSGSVAMNVDTPFGKAGSPQSSKQATNENGNLLYTDKQGNTTVNATGMDGSVNKAKPAEGLASLQADYGMGYGSDKDSQSSVTKSGINTKNLIIKDEVEQQRRTGKTAVETIAAIKTDLTTDNAQAQSGKLTNHFDKDNVQKELDLQREVTESFGKTVTESGTLIADKLSEDARKKKYEAAVELEKAQNALKENDNETNRTLLVQAKANFDTANADAQEWETGGSQRRILDSALNVLSTALGGRPVAEVIASGLSPTVNQQIKEATTDKNGNVNAALNLTAHALWGAVEAYAGKHNVAAGVAGAVTGEVAAGIISQILYDKSPDKLSQEEKVTVSTLSQVAAGLAGGTLANSSDGTMIAAKTAKEAVEHNSLADDIHPSVEREQNIAMYAKVYFKGDEDKAREFIEGQEIAEARGQIDSVKDLVQAISNPLETAKSLWDVVSNPSETYDQILISEAQWRDAYENALENDPKLAGEMSGHLRGSLKGVPTGGVLLTGSGVAMAKSIAKVSDVIKSGKLNLARGTIPNSEVGIQWGKGISNQGKPWEAYVQSKLPEGAINLNDIKPNFKTFDHILPDGTAISSKTMDTIGSKTYQKPSKITYTLNKYVDEMVNFKEDGKGITIISSSEIKSRELYLAIPAKTTKEQMNAINKSIDYARSKGTNIIVNKVN